MSYEQYAQIETSVLNMPYKQKMQLLHKIADNLKNIKVIETANLQTKNKTLLRYRKRRIFLIQNFDEDNEEIAKLFGAV